MPTRSVCKARLFLSGLVFLLVSISFISAALADPPIIGTPPNTNNVISYHDTNEDTGIIITLTAAVDPEGDPVTYRITNLPTDGSLFQVVGAGPGVEITAPDTVVTNAARQVYYQPQNQSSAYEDRFYAKAADATDDSPNNEILIVRVDADNDPPTFTSTPETIVQVGNRYTYTAVVADPDGDDPPRDLIIEPVDLPGFLSLNNNGDGTATISGIPDGSYLGNQLITLSVRDDSGLTDAGANQSYTLTVVVDTRALTVSEDGQLEILLGPPTDDDGETLAYSIDAFPAFGKLYQYNSGELGAEITAGNPAVSDAEARIFYVPQNRSVTYGEEIYVISTDPTGEDFTSEQISILVIADNNAPYITSGPATTGTIDSPYSYTLEAEDPDQDQLLSGRVYSIVQGPSFLNMIQNGDGTATLSGVPTSAFAGTHAVTLRVADAAGLFDDALDQSFVLTVLPPEVLEFTLADFLNAISTDTYWDQDKVIIKAGEGNNAEALIIKPGVTLTIAPGTTLDIRDGLGMLVLGGLVADGTVERKITFDGDLWGGIVYSSPDRDSVMDNVEIKGVKGEFSGAVAVSNTDRVTLSRINITSPEAVYGAGLYLQNADITASDITVEGAKNTQRGGGLYIDGGSPVVSDSKFTGGSECQWGAGAYIAGGTPRIINTEFSGNTAQAGGGIYVAGGSPEFINLFIVNNTGTTAGGGLVLESGSPVVRHCTISRNLAPEGPGIYIAGGTPDISGTILYFNTLSDKEGGDSGEFQQVWLAGGSPSFSWSDIQGGADSFGGGSNLLDEDPLFVSPSPISGAGGAGSDWSLDALSGLINGGSLSPGYVGSVDIAGYPRIYNDIRIDMGCYEFRNNPPTLPDSLVRLENITEDLPELLITAAADLGEPTDPDPGDTLTWVVTRLPLYGKLYQADGGVKGDEITIPGGDAAPGEVVAIPLTDPDARLIYVPQNRSASYEDRFSIAVQDNLDHRDDLTDDEKECLRLTSEPELTALIRVTADNDPPKIITSPDSTEAPVSFLFSYEAEATDPDADHADDSLAWIWDIKPDWLDFTDNGNGTALLAGTPEASDVGEHRVVIRVGDPGGAYGEQAFILSVTQPIQLSVSAGEDRTTAPGQTIFLSIEGEPGEGLTYSWEITDSRLRPVKTAEGDAISWTADVEGVYKATVTVSDDLGSIPGSDDIQITVAEGFAEVDDDRREYPTAEEQATIEAMGSADPTSPDFDAAATAAAAAALSAKALSPAQRDKILTGIEAVLADPEPSSKDVNNVLGALDNLVMEDHTDGISNLTKEQVNRALDAVQKIADLPPPSDAAMPPPEPAAEQAAAIDAIGGALPTDPGYDAESLADTVASTAGLTLSGDQQDSVLAAMTNNAEAMTPDQADKMTEALGAIAADAAISGDTPESRARRGAAVAALAQVAQAQGTDIPAAEDRAAPSEEQAEAINALSSANLPDDAAAVLASLAELSGLTLSPAQAEKIADAAAAVASSDGVTEEQKAEVTASLARLSSAVPDTRAEPSEEQAAEIQALAAFDPAGGSGLPEGYEDPAALVAAVEVLSALKLSGEQADELSAAIDRLLTESAPGTFSNEEISSLIIAKDTTEAGQAEGAALPDSVKKRMLNALGKSAGPDNAGLDRRTLVEIQAAKTIEILNELVEQQGLENLTREEMGKVNDTGRSLLARCASIRANVKADTGPWVQLSMVSMLLRDPWTYSEAPSVELGSETPDTSDALFAEQTLSEIHARMGTALICFGLLANAVTDGHGTVATLLVESGEGEEVTGNAGDKATPVKLEWMGHPGAMRLPLSVEGLSIPYRMPPGAEFWQEDGLTKVDDQDEPVIRFTLDTLESGDYALFSADNLPISGDDRSDAEQLIDAVEEAGSGGGCFIGGCAQM